MVIRECVWTIMNRTHVLRSIAAPRELNKPCVCSGIPQGIVVGHSLGVMTHQEPLDGNFEGLASQRPWYLRYGDDLVGHVAR
jgi:hypothetical protein